MSAAAAIGSILGVMLAAYGIASWPWIYRAPEPGWWSADVPGEGGNPDVDQNPKRGEPGHVKGVGYGPTPLIAAMRAFVASRS
jgi:hypothetical protein